MDEEGRRVLRRQQRGQLRVLVAWLVCMVAWVAVRGPAVLPDAVWMTSIIVGLGALFWRKSFVLPARWRRHRT